MTTIQHNSRESLLIATRISFSRSLIKSLVFVKFITLLKKYFIFRLLDMLTVFFPHIDDVAIAIYCLLTMFIHCSCKYLVKHHQFSYIALRGKQILRTVCGNRIVQSNGWVDLNVFFFSPSSIYLFIEWWMNLRKKKKNFIGKCIRWKKIDRFEMHKQIARPIRNVRNIWYGIVVERKNERREVEWACLNRQPTAK